jgi:hypothetical protein
MKGGLRWLVPPACLALGLYGLRLSYRAYVKWQELIALGDPSGAEIYEVEFWPEVSIGLLLIALAAFLAGRWSVAGRHGGSN